MQKDSVENRITFIEKIFHLYKKLDKFRLKFLEQLIIIMIHEENISHIARD